MERLDAAREALEAKAASKQQEILGKLEEVARELDRRVVEGSCDLLIVATSRIFSNLARMLDEDDDGGEEDAEEEEVRAADGEGTS